jgi:drug/metabolite transporter (DMT)-like permease
LVFLLQHRRRFWYARPLPPPSSPSKLLPGIAVGFCVLAWGSSFVASRHLLHPGTQGRATLDPVTLALARFTIASIFFAAPFGLALFRRRISGGDLLRLALLGQLAFSVYFWLQNTGIQKTNAGMAAILAVGLFPSATGVLAPLGGERRPSAGAWAALVLGFAGVAVLVTEKPVAVSGSADFVIGALCLVANAFAFAAYSLLGRRWMKDLPPLTKTGGAMIFGAIGLFLISLATGAGGVKSLAAIDASQWGALGFLALACSVGGYFAWNFALSRVEAGRISHWIYAEPVVASALGWTLLGERYGWAALAGAAAIALSVILANRLRRPAG